MRILVTASIQDFDKLEKAVVAVRQKVVNTAQVISGEDVPWESILATEGSWDGAYSWAVRAFDALTVVETESGCLGRGTYEMVRKFLDKSMSVGVVRGEEIKEVKDVRVFDKHDWKQNYGILVL